MTMTRGVAPLWVPATWEGSQVGGVAPQHPPALGQPAQGPQHPPLGGRGGATRGGVPSAPPQRDPSPEPGVGGDVVPQATHAGGPGGGVGVGVSWRDLTRPTSTGPAPQAWGSPTAPTCRAGGRPRPAPRRPGTRGPAARGAGGCPTGWAAPRRLLRLRPRPAAASSSSSSASRGRGWGEAPRSEPPRADPRAGTPLVGRGAWGCPGAGAHLLPAAILEGAGHFAGLREAPPLCAPRPRPRPTEGAWPPRPFWPFAPKATGRRGWAGRFAPPLLPPPISAPLAPEG